MWGDIPTSSKNRYYGSPFWVEFSLHGNFWRESHSILSVHCVKIQWMPFRSCYPTFLIFPPFNCHNTYRLSYSFSDYISQSHYQKMHLSKRLGCKRFPTSLRRKTPEPRDVIHLQFARRYWVANVRLLRKWAVVGARNFVIYTQGCKLGE